MKATFLIFSDVRISKYAQRRTLQKAATLCSSVNLLCREHKSRKLQKCRRSMGCPLRMSTIDDACREADFGIAWNPGKMGLDVHMESKNKRRVYHDRGKAERRKSTVREHRQHMCHTHQVLTNISLPSNHFYSQIPLTHVCPRY